MSLILERKTFLRTVAKVGLGLFAFIPAARALTEGRGTPAAPPALAGPARRFEIPNYVAGRVTAVSPRALKVQTHQREVTLELPTEMQEFWKGAFAPQAEPLEVGDFVDVWGEPNHDRSVYLVQRLYANIVNRIGTISGVHTQEEATRLAHFDRRMKPADQTATVTVDRRTLVDLGQDERTYDSRVLRLREGQWLQVIGLRLRDGSIRATRIFV
ncbi:MAG TPA: DUF5666 domain-containing protein [Chloroflexota bacterium]|nr:DUF5666 domain-containing protein [Chloroflexota bacterium]